MGTNAASKSGQMNQSDFSDNIGGTNLADSAFRINSSQAAGGYNFDYILTGGVRKRLGPVKINSVADTELRTLGQGQYATASGGTKANIRAAGTKLQLVTTSPPASFTALTQDTVAASSNPFTSGTTVQVNFAQFNNGISNILWATGGGATLPLGVTSTTKFTQNGVPVLTGSFTATPAASGVGDWTATGTYFYAVGLRKASTQAVSNAALDKSAVISNTTDTVTIDLSGLTAFDTTTYDAIILYRSTVSGASAFTTGDIVTVLSTGTTLYTDFGDIGGSGATGFLSSQNIPRSGNIVLDNSVLPSGTYATPVLFKNRLVVTSGNVAYLSEINASESWPATNSITIPSPGPITGTAVVSFTSPQAQSLNEILVIFKERETWVLNGDSALGAVGNQIGDPWSLLSIDNSTGCSNHSLIVNCQGWLAWIDFRGVHLWDGTGKPYYASRMIEPLFAYGGDLDKTKFSFGCGQFFRRENQIIWYLSSKTFGEQVYALKMDMRLTFPQVQQQLTGRSIDAIFIQDTFSFPIYSALSYLPASANQEQMSLGDKSGFLYFASNGNSDAGSGISWTYLTPPLSMGDPNTKKHFHKVIAWVQDVGDWNLELDFWTDYRTSTGTMSVLSVPLSMDNTAGMSLWDVAVWDVSTWDSFNSNTNIVPVVFNLSSATQNNFQGSALQLQFKNTAADEPVTIHGYSVFWSDLGGVTA